MKRTIQYFILFEAATFIIAACIHAGVIATGYEFPKAYPYESVIAIVLIIGLLVSWIRPAWTRVTGMTVQGFAFLGTCVGLSTIISGMGPQTILDVVYHITILIVLGWGIATAKRAQLRKV